MLEYELKKTLTFETTEDVVIICHSERALKTLLLSYCYLALLTVNDIKRYRCIEKQYEIDKYK